MFSFWEDVDFFHFFVLLSIFKFILKQEAVFSSWEEWRVKWIREISVLFYNLWSRRVSIDF